MNIPSTMPTWLQLLTLLGSRLTCNRCLCWSFAHHCFHTHTHCKDCTSTLHILFKIPMEHSILDLWCINTIACRYAWIRSNFMHQVLKIVQHFFFLSRRYYLLHTHIRCMCRCTTHIMHIVYNSSVFDTHSHIKVTHCEHVTSSHFNFAISTLEILIAGSSKRNIWNVFVKIFSQVLVCVCVCMLTLTAHTYLFLLLEYFHLILNFFPQGFQSLFMCNWI